MWLWSGWEEGGRAEAALLQIAEVLEGGTQCVVVGLVSEDDMLWGEGRPRSSHLTEAVAEEGGSTGRLVELTM